jgi:hypothetical protein
MSDGLRQAGPHRVRDVRTDVDSWTVICMKCNAEWPEGGSPPKVCK